MEVAADGLLFLQKTDRVFSTRGGETPYICRSIPEVMYNKEPQIIEKLVQVKKKTDWGKKKDLNRWDPFKLNKPSDNARLHDRVKADPVHENFEENKKIQLVDGLERIAIRKRGALGGWQLVGEAYVKEVRNGDGTKSAMIRNFLMKSR